MSDVVLLEENIDVDSLVEEFHSLKYSLKQTCKFLALQSYRENGTLLDFMEEGFSEEKSSRHFKHLTTDLTRTNSYIAQYGMYRTRYMGLAPKSCLRWHHDYQWRIHIPLITNEKCFIVIEDKSYHLKSGNIYAIDARKYHTVFNGNHDFYRLHIVGMSYDNF